MKSKTVIITVTDSAALPIRAEYEGSVNNYRTLEDAFVDFPHFLEGVTQANYRSGRAHN